MINAGYYPLLKTTFGYFLECKVCAPYWLEQFNANSQILS